jgi:hypothetical protein
VRFHLDITCRAEEVCADLLHGTLSTSFRQRSAAILFLPRCFLRLVEPMFVHHSGVVPLLPLHAISPCSLVPLQTAVGPGQLMSQAWADSGRQWRTFQYSVPFRWGLGVPLALQWTIRSASCCGISLAS